MHRCLFFSFLSVCYLASNLDPLISVSYAKSAAAHKHGSMNINVGYIGKTLEIELNSPLDNLVGFEHKARNKKERESLKNLDRFLKKPEGLFEIFPVKSCKVEKVEILEGAYKEEKRDKNHTKDHSHHGHADDHKTVHNEIVVRYKFNCSKHPESIQTKIFKKFGSVKELSVQLITSKGQWKLELSPKKTVIGLRK